MSSNICYEKDSNQKDNVNKNDVCYDIQGKRQTFRNSRVSKGREEQQYTKYVTGQEDSGGCYPAPQTRADDSDAEYINAPTSDTTRPRNICSTRRNDSNEYSRRASADGVKRGRVCDPDPRYSDSEYGDIKYGTKTLPPHCYDMRLRRKCQPCTEKTKWQNAKYCRDDCGSGIVPLRYNYNISRQVWCRTPLTTYQASHGELGRKILCGEKEFKKLSNEGPPCNICEYIFPPCRGYYRRYDCVKPCEDESEMVVFRNGRNRLRDKVERYWESCFTGQAKQDVNKYAPQNMALAIKYRKKAFGGTGAPCW